VSVHDDQHDDDTPGTPQDDWFLRAAARVGDLTSPFYAEERQRDVWNEASAVGLQLMLWLGLATSTAMVWIGGRESLPYAISLFALVGAVSGVSLAYARRLGVAVEAPARTLTARLLPYLLLLAAFLAGVVRAAPDDGFPGGFAHGAAGGAALAVVALVVGGARARRRDAAA